jgi:NAD(P) transhydrogenase subunit beta
MPITISLLNSLSGLAASVCGFAVGDVLLIAVGAVVGASGLILTRIMCRAMNRSLADILTGMTSVAQDTRSEIITPSAEKGKAFASEEETFAAIANILAEARSVIVVPGYGMALAQAQNRVKELYDLLEQKGVSVKFAIHPVAGRMPGHMNVLLAEVDVPYEKLFELDDINPEFSSTDAVLVVGACDVVNPMAITAEGTPIYGMPILHVHEAKHVIVCNLDEKPGYSGVQNPLYEKEHVILAFGNAEETIGHIVRHIRSA